MSAMLRRYASIAMLVLSAFTLIGVHWRPYGWVLLAVGAAVTLLVTQGAFRRDLSLLYGALAILGVTPISTDTSVGQASIMTLGLVCAVVGPYVVSRFLFKDRHIRYSWHHGRNWYRREILYIGVTAAVAYLVLPFYLVNSGAYLNWPSETDAGSLVRLFIGTNSLGIWDELFFICTVLGILRRYLPFWQANLAQAIMFTSFLYELGFTGWGPLPVFALAITQGYIFKRTDSLLYVVTIHLTIDFILYFALINAHHPNLVPFFITR